MIYPFPGAWVPYRPLGPSGDLFNCAASARGGLRGRLGRLAPWLNLYTQHRYRRPNTIEILGLEVSGLQCAGQGTRTSLFNRKLTGLAHSRHVSISISHAPGRTMNEY